MMGFGETGFLFALKSRRVRNFVNYKSLLICIAKKTALTGEVGSWL